MQRQWIAAARNAAKQLVRRFGVQAPAHIRVEAMCKYLGIDIIDVQLHGASAQLVRSGKRAVIMVSDRITDPAARKFSIAHELGHFMLKHPAPSAAELCLPHMPRSRSNRERSLEAEANAFASELLMPESLLAERCNVQMVDLSVPRAIEEDYGVSILASTIRFIELTRACCAAVFSADREVKWFVPSTTFTRYIPRGRPIDPLSVAADFFTKGEVVREPQLVRADAWLETDRDVDVVEHAICSPQHGTVLSLLWVPEQVAFELGMFTVASGRGTR